jgi:hypothetical protein
MMEGLERAGLLLLALCVLLYGEYIMFQWYSTQQALHNSSAVSEYNVYMCVHVCT